MDITPVVLLKDGRCEKKSCRNMVFQDVKEAKDANKKSRGTSKVFTLLVDLSDTDSD